MKAWQWIAWNANRERICDCGIARADNEQQARGIAWQCIGGPHLESIVEIQVKRVEQAEIPKLRETLAAALTRLESHYEDRRCSGDPLVDPEIAAWRAVLA